MRVFVTGGTGFVGSHTVAELVRSGHEVRLLVRSPDRIAPALAPFGIDGADHAIGDVTDRESVAKGMTGCDAVVHAASVYTLDVRKSNLVRAVNVQGTEVVLAAAEEGGLDPVVYVSALGSLYPPDGVLDERSPVKGPPGVYYRSKADAERVARAFQERGVPVASSLPGGVFGPHDPHFGESAQIVANVLKLRMPLVPHGGLSIVDVRDLARAHAAMVAPGLGPRRYVFGGTNVSFAAIVHTLAEETGRRIPVVSLPAWSLSPVARAGGALQRVLPFRLPLNVEGFDTLAWNPRTDDSRAREELGFAPRPTGETLRDTAAWLYSDGRISARQAGKLAGA